MKTFVIVSFLCALFIQPAFAANKTKARQPSSAGEFSCEAPEFGDLNSVRNAMNGKCDLAQPFTVFPTLLAKGSSDGFFNSVKYYGYCCISK